jgi:hypothetical protein
VTTTPTVPPREYSKEYPQLTKKQWAVLKFIIDHINRTRGIIPSYREMMAHFQVQSTNSIACHIKRLVEKNYLLDNTVKGLHHQARSFSVNWDKIHCPIISAFGGRVRITMMPTDLTPERARRVAKAILRAADRVEGLDVTDVETVGTDDRLPPLEATEEEFAPEEHTSAGSSTPPADHEASPRPSP